MLGTATGGYQHRRSPESSIDCALIVSLFLGSDGEVKGGFLGCSWLVSLIRRASLPQSMLPLASAYLTRRRDQRRSVDGSV